MNNVSHERQTVNHRRPGSKPTSSALVELPRDGNTGVADNTKKPEWAKRETRSVGIDRRAKVGMEVLMRPEVRPDIIALAVSHGMAGQKFIEHLIVKAINDEPENVIKGEQLIKRAKGNIRHAIALAQEELSTPSTGSSSFRERLEKSNTSDRSLS
ncbi:MAG: hypothetical protein E6P95_01510 [Candidatus Moraniibacteriota bacterium]|nr:MAG: hypothetical protein E6P95_01510 [Candidatus Moranbacteria bacterium]